jgi:hypothetical protein
MKRYHANELLPFGIAGLLKLIIQRLILMISIHGIAIGWPQNLGAGSHHLFLMLSNRNVC